MKLPAKLREALESTGRPWELRQGGRHIHILVDGRIASIWSRCPRGDKGRNLANTVAAIRRAARG